MSTHLIRTDLLPSLLKSIAPIARKCLKKNIPYDYKEIGKQFKEIELNGITKYIEFTEIELNINPCINGWNVIVQIRQLENGHNLITRCNVPYKKEYDNYITSEIHCEHCKQNRRRKTAYILENESGQTMIVGSTCLEEFTGGLDASVTAQCFELLNNIREIEGKCSDYSNVSNEITNYDPEFILNIAFAVMERDGGYIKNSNANSTTNGVKEYLSGNDSITGLSINDNTAKSRQYLNWIKEYINNKEELNSYERNLKTVCNADRICWSELATFCSLIPVYERNNKNNSENEQRINEYFGELKQRIEIDVKNVESHYFDSFYGSFYIHVITSLDGHTFVWKTGKCIKRNHIVYMKDSNVIYAEETPIKLKGTISSFEEYRGIKQTELKRCEILSSAFINKETNAVINEKDENIDYIN